MKRILAGLIGGVILAGLTFGTAFASDDDRYEYNERHEYGNVYYNPYRYTNSGYTNYGYASNEYRENERHEYNDDRYEHSGRYNTGTAYPSSNIVYGNVGYTGHEMYEHRR